VPPSRERGPPSRVTAEANAEMGIVRRPTACAGGPHSNHDDTCTIALPRLSQVAPARPANTRERSDVDVRGRFECVGRLMESPFTAANMTFASYYVRTRAPSPPGDALSTDCQPFGG
jgi:hypothetical protein